MKRRPPRCTRTYKRFPDTTLVRCWGAVLALRSRPITDPDAIGLALAIGKTFDALGTAALRLTVVGWTDAVEASWREVENDYPLCFDWDFVPAWIIDHIDWSDPFHQIGRAPCRERVVQYV